MSAGTLHDNAGKEKTSSASPSGEKPTYPPSKTSSWLLWFSLAGNSSAARSVRDCALTVMLQKVFSGGQALPNQSARAGAPHKETFRGWRVHPVNGG